MSSTTHDGSRPTFIEPADRFPFRHMRLTLKLAQAQVGLLLSLDVLTWAENDYSLFLVMVEMWHVTENPTYPQMVSQLAAWLRFNKRLIDALPESDLREKATAEFDKLSVQYGALLEVTK